MRNDIAFCWDCDGVPVKSHFRLREFEGADGLVVVDSGLVRSLELVRRDLCERFGSDVQILITSGTRSHAENEKLAQRLGWVEDGGQVARDSKHLPEHGGIAIDCYARYLEGDVWVIVPQTTLGSACRVHFTFVKDDYPDGHVHADNRAE